MADETPLPYGDPWSNTVPVPAQPAHLPLPLPVTAPLPGPDPVIVQIGEIRVSSTTVYTPAGQFPLKGSQWTVTDQWIAEQKIPAYAVVLAIVGFFCLTVLSLLFLLIKETVYSGVVVVQVHSGPHHYVSRVPVANQAYVQHVYQQVNYVRSLAAL
jgi:hypothetical protein